MVTDQFGLSMRSRTDTLPLDAASQFSVTSILVAPCAVATQGMSLRLSPAGPVIADRVARPSMLRAQPPKGRNPADGTVQTVCAVA